MSNERRRWLLVALVGALLSFGVAAGAVTTTTDLDDGLTPDQLAQALAGTGVTISNVAYSGNNQSAGTFTETDASVFGFDDGVVLSSGFVDDIVGPNDNPALTQDTGTGGDSDLSSLAGIETFNSTVLEFDFVPDDTTLFVSYVFASEEYNEYVNSQFNDVFAFFVNGENCALVNGAPVTINTVNGGNPLGTDATNPSLYRNNDDASINIQPDGLTVTLVCEAEVNAGVTNTMKLAIADGSDTALDSWVVLQAGGVTTEPPTNDPPTVDAGVDVSGSEGSPTQLDGTANDPDGDALTLTWSYVAGIDVDAGATCSFSDATVEDPTITCTDDGTYTLTLTGDDGAAPAVQDTSTLTVGNVAPDISSTSPEDMSSHQVGSTINVAAGFSDPGSNDTHTCTVDWGDGSSQPGAISASQCTHGHAYAGPGLYTIVITVTDDDGGSDSAEFTVVIFDQATKVSGGGFVIADERTSFGFIAQQDGPELSGQLQVRAPGKHRFHGNTVSSLTVAGNTATWTGSGRWDGIDGYTFEVTVVDNRNGGGKSPKKGDPDHIAITILAPDSTVIHTVSSDLTGGNIKVH